MSLRPTLALLALVSLPLMAAQNDPQPSSKELMKEHQAQIQNDLADVDYKRKRIVEANMNLTPTRKARSSGRSTTPTAPSRTSSARKPSSSCSTTPRPTTAATSATTRRAS